MKVLIIGIDAMDPALVFRLVGEGKLPTIAGLIKNGTSGTLSTTIPPYSMVAWTSFMTGRNPGGHGIFSNFRFKNNSYEQVINNANHITVPYFLDFLGKYDKRSLIFSVLSTYPVKPLNGLCIGGYSTPSDDVDFTYPKELREEIQSKFDYRLHYTNVKEFHSKGQHKEMLDMFYDRMERKVKTFCHYLRKEPWDFCVSCITKGDTISHYYWKDMLEGSEHKSVVEEWYQTADSYVKRLIDAAGPNVNVILMSDHGFHAPQWNVNLNNFLVEKGYLRVRKEPLRARVLGKVGLTKKNARDLLIRLGFEKSLDKISGKLKDVLPGTTTRNIDFAKTTAFVKEIAPEYGLVYVNTTGQFPGGTVTPEQYVYVVGKLAEDLKSLKHN